MAEENVQKEIGPKSWLTKPQAVGIMVAAGALILLAWFVPAEQGSTFHAIKVGVGLLGFVGLCVGAYYRP